MHRRLFKSVLVLLLGIGLVATGAQVVLADGGRNGSSARGPFFDATLTPTPTGQWTGNRSDTRTDNGSQGASSNAQVNKPAGIDWGGIRNGFQDFFKNLQGDFNRPDRRYEPVEPTATPTPVPTPVCTQLPNDTAHHVTVSCVIGVTADIQAPRGDMASITSVSDTTTLPDPPYVNFLGDAVTLSVTDPTGASVAYVPGEICFADPSESGNVFMWVPANSAWMYISTVHITGMDCGWFWTPGIYTRN